ncbi:hypothetical protein LZB41_09145, partial [Campylobacter jejuni]|nr:hypothetical protein [Campylobacter jejuni]
MGYVYRNKLPVTACHSSFPISHERRGQVRYDGRFLTPPSPMPALRASWFPSPLSQPAVLTAACLLALAVLPAAQAQTARKPSPYENVIEPVKARPLTPAEIEARKAEDARRGGPAFMARIDDEAAFRQLARVYNAG